MNGERRPAAVHGIRVLDERGEFGAPTRVSWAGGRFALGTGAGGAGSGASGSADRPGGRGEARRADEFASADRLQSADRFAGSARLGSAGEFQSADAFEGIGEFQGADGSGSRGRRDSADALQSADEFDGTGLWMIPGLVDVHVHAAWQAFDAEDRARLGEERTLELIAAGLRRTLAAGFTSARDAGGLDPDVLAAIPGMERPRMQLSVRMIDRAAADAAGGVDRAVEEALAAGARWVKLVATAGVAAPVDAGLDPVFTPAEQSDAVRRAERAGAGVMVHAWGGRAVDDAIEAGALSIEHGIFLTDAQAARAAERGMTLVPTLRIYRLVQRMIEAGSLPAAFRSRVDAAVAAHPRAVLRARDAGLAIALGTDYGTAEQHGTGRLEFDALIVAGLTPQEALVAATRSGAELLARVSGGAGPAGRGGAGTGGSGGGRGASAGAEGSTEGAGASEGGARARAGEGNAGAGASEGGSGSAAVCAGVIAHGGVADAVILRRDPGRPGALSDPAAVVAVILGGRWIGPSSLV
ncbi:MAG: amidohydrolase family protein [Leucobacter sp.]